MPEKSTKAKGGSLLSDIGNLAIPFGLLLTAHGVGYASKKLSKTSTPTGGKPAAKKSKPAKKSAAKKSKK